MIKRTLSILLALVMVVGLLPVTAFAAVTEPIVIIWDDGGDKYHNRPGSVDLYFKPDNGSEVHREITGTGDTWNTTVSLDFYYTNCRIDPPNGYYPEIVGAGGTTIITLRNNTLDIDVNMVWEDDNNASGDRPETFQVKVSDLTTNDLLGTVQGNVPASGNSHTLGTITVPYYYNKQAIALGFTQSTPGGYDLTPNFNQSTKTYTLTLTKKQEATTTVSIQWDDQDNKYHNRPEKMLVGWGEKGTNTTLSGYDVYLSPENNWTGTIPAQPEGTELKYTQYESDIYTVTHEGNDTDGYVINYKLVMNPVEVIVRWVGDEEVTGARTNFGVSLSVARLDGSDQTTPDVLYGNPVRDTNEQTVGTLYYPNAYYGTGAMSLIRGASPQTYYDVDVGYTEDSNGKTTQIIVTYTYKKPEFITVTYDAGEGVFPENGNSHTLTETVTESNGNLFTIMFTKQVPVRDGYVFKGWTNIMGGSEPFDSLGVSYAQDMKLYAVWEVAPTQYTITAAPNDDNYGTVTGAGTYNQGTNVTLTAAAKDGYRFVGWTENGTTVSTGASYTFKAEADRNLVAVFEKIPTYTISATPNPAAGGTVTGAGTYEENTQITLKAIANSGYRFVGWTENGTTVSTDAALSITVTKNRDLVAEFKPEYTIAVSASKDEYGIVTGSGVFLEGEDVTVTATAKEGYRFVKWTEGGKDIGTDAELTLTNVTANHTLVAVFEPITFTITAAPNDDNYGSVTGAGTYNQGTNVTLTAAAKEGYRFVGWTENGTTVSTVASYTFKAEKDRDLVAVFEKIPTYTISATPNPAVGGSVTGAGTYEENTQITLTAVPEDGYRFVGWTENGITVSTVASYTFKAEADRNLVAVFEVIPTTTYTITASPDPTVGGTIEGDGICYEGDDVTLKAIANSGYRFVGWTENGTTVSTEASYTFKAEKDRDLVAVFEKIPTYTISATPNPAVGGSVTGAGTYEENTQITLTAVPEDGYRFVGWTENGITVSTDTALPITVTANRTLVAVFEPITFTITAASNNPDYGSVTGAGTYNQGTNVTLTAVPDDGYRFVGWTENGITVSTDAALPITVTANRTLVAVFEPITFTITAASNNPDYGSVTGAGTYNQGTNVTLTAVPEDGYRFVGWTKDGVTVSEDASYTFTVTQNCELVAVFEAIVLDYLEITTAPTKTTYAAGESFDAAGMVVTAYYNNGTSKVITDYTVTDGNNLTEGKTSVTISYTDGEVTKTAQQTITVKEKVGVGVGNTFEDNDSGLVFEVLTQNGLTGTVKVTFKDNSTKSAYPGVTYNVPSTVEKNGVTYTVTLIGWRAFALSENLTGITLPGTVAELDDYAFTWTKLTSMVMPEGLTDIYACVFEGCSYLTEVTLPNSLDHIGGHAFNQCQSLKDVYYNGTKSEWNQIHIGSDNDELLNATIHYSRVTITLNAAGGTVSPGSTVIDNGGTLTELPTPTRTGFLFGGWYDASGAEVTTSTVFTADTTLTAKWTECGHANNTAKPDCENDATCSVCQGNIPALGHDYADTWTKGETTHYYPCSRCDAKKDEADHGYDNACDTDCNVCGKTRTITHSYTDLKHSDTEHWYECAVCHAEKPDSREDHKGGTATCTGQAVCEVCGEEYGTPNGNNHDFAATWTQGEETHYYACSRCDAKKDEAAHAYDNACDTTCNVCGKVRTITHAYAEQFDEDGHWQECSICHHKKDIVQGHSFDDDLDSSCNGCGFTRTVSYAITAGNKQSVTKGNNATFTSNADFSRFLRVEVDGKTVDSRNYTAVSGSTKVTLKAAYIETLSAGEHTLTIVSTDGSATTTFTVKNKPAPVDPDVPKTGDTTLSGMWLTLAGIGIVGLLASIFGKKYYLKRR